MPSRSMRALGQFLVTACIRRRFVPAVLMGLAVVVARYGSLCHVHEKRMMREPEATSEIPVRTSIVRLCQSVRSCTPVPEINQELENEEHTTPAFRARAARGTAPCCQHAADTRSAREQENAQSRREQAGGAWLLIGAT